MSDTTRPSKTKYFLKFRNLKFVERKKVLRKIKTAEKDLVEALKSGADTATVSGLHDALESLKSDIDYIRFYPSDRPYYPLFPKEQASEDIITKQEEVRKIIAEKQSKRRRQDPEAAKTPTKKNRAPSKKKRAEDGVLTNKDLAKSSKLKRNVESADKCSSESKKLKTKNTEAQCQISATDSLANSQPNDRSSQAKKRPSLKECHVSRVPAVEPAKASSCSGDDANDDFFGNDSLENPNVRLRLLRGGTRHGREWKRDRNHDDQWKEDAEESSAKKSCASRWEKPGVDYWGKPEKKGGVAWWDGRKAKKEASLSKADQEIPQEPLQEKIDKREPRKAAADTRATSGWKKEVEAAKVEYSHPSWAAKASAQGRGQIVEFSGSRVTFDDEDDD